MSNMKKYILTAVTLGSIGAVSALLIGLTNLATRGQIAANAENKIKKGLTEIYRDATFSDKVDIDGDDKYLDCYYTAIKDEATIGYVFQTTGSNMYGKISMLVGVSKEFEANRIFFIVDEQTYATTLEDNYITPFNNGNHDLDDVICGATYGAKLVKEMAEEATSWAEKNLGGVN